jgi:membrane protease YdiL (CAAX protease family)
MSDLPQNDPFLPGEIASTTENILEPTNPAADALIDASERALSAGIPGQLLAGTQTEVEPGPLVVVEPLPQNGVNVARSEAEPLLFQGYEQHPISRPARIPHFGHLALLGCGILPVAFLCTSLLTRSAIYFHLFGVSTLNAALTEIHYTLGSMAVLYLLTLLGCVIIFPLIWHKGFFAGVQWQGATAIRLRSSLLGAAFVCFLLALLSGWVMPGPTNAPIDKLFRTPVAAWLMFGFGVSFAPFFEEILFRGFLLPALCTAFDWTVEKVRDLPPTPLGANGHPEWSGAAMVTGSILTSLPFAYMHAEQTGHSAGPLILLVCVSLILCSVRLVTRSLAASVMVHACYNLLLFSLMVLGTSGFRHLDKM